MVTSGQSMIDQRIKHRSSKCVNMFENTAWISSHNYMQFQINLLVQRRSRTSPVPSGSMASRVMHSKRKSSVFQKRVYPTCGTVDFMTVRKGRSFMEPLLRRTNRDPSCQRINGLSKRGRTGHLGCFTNFTLTICVAGIGATPTGRGSTGSTAEPTVYTTDFIDSLLRHGTVLFNQVQPSTAYSYQRLANRLKLHRDGLPQSIAPQNLGVVTSHWRMGMIIHRYTHCQTYALTRYPIHCQTHCRTHCQTRCRVHGGISCCRKNDLNAVGCTGYLNEYCGHGLDLRLTTVAISEM
ncbi:hypothetical protein Btru_039247 [Bulinus truncatus]|nr:hypothetical protein Btru_039247 [Bulinus truncatus]